MDCLHTKSIEMQNRCGNSGRGEDDAIFDVKIRENRTPLDQQLEF
jgi:hypothetical protein